MKGGLRVLVLGGALAGLVGIAVGELTQTMLTVRKKVPVQVSTGTSAFVLHLTVVSARSPPSRCSGSHRASREGFTVPFGVGTFVAIGRLFGGQMGAYLKAGSPRRRSYGR